MYQKKFIAAPRAFAEGIIDEIVSGDLLDGALAFALARAKAGEVRKTRDLSPRVASRDDGIAACQAARATLSRTARGARAPLVCVEAIEAAVTMDFEAGSARERELFADCVLSTESRAMVHLFFAEREAAKVPGVPRTPRARCDPRGRGRRWNDGRRHRDVYANAGIPVLLKEIDQPALDRGLMTIRSNYESTVAKGRMTQDALERTMALITPTTTFDGFDRVDIVVEAVFENMDVKKQTFAELARATRADAVLASNTSTLDIDQLGAASGRPSQVIGHHFFSPANVMKLMEIVRGKETSAEVIATSLKLVAD